MLQMRGCGESAGGEDVKTPTLLYHFTCNHGFEGIRKTNVLLPNAHPLMLNLGAILWLTDLSEPTKEAVGLTNSWTTCDRLAYRYIVRCKAAAHWSKVRQRAPKDIVETLESYGQPEHWWIVRRPVLASEFSFDETWRKGAAS